MKIIHRLLSYPDFDEAKEAPIRFSNGVGRPAERTVQGAFGSGIPGFFKMILCSVFLLTTACEDFLTVPPADELSRAEALMTIRGSRAAVVGIYALAAGGNLYESDLILYPEMAGNLAPFVEVGRDPNALGTERNTYVEAHTFTVDADYDANAFAAIYRDLYTALYQTVDVLTTIDALEEGSPEERSSLRGEAHAFRAFFHFELLRLFAQSYGFTADAGHPGVVLIEALPTVSDAPARATVREGYELIVRDLEAAISRIDPVYSRRNGEPQWWTPEVARALLLRVELYRQNWAAVVRLADEILSATGPSLTPTEDYVEEWAEGRLRETLLALNVTGESSPLTRGITRAVVFGNDEPELSVTTDLYDLFAADDRRRSLYAIFRGDDRLTLKYSGYFEVQKIPDPVLFRLSEVYLSRAEAYAELGRDAEAREDYNRIHQRAVPNADALSLEGEALIAEILRERRRELALEGHLLYDLSRRGLTVDRQDCADYVLNCDLIYPDHRFILPIPRDALFRNPNLRQNEGY